MLVKEDDQHVSSKSIEMAVAALLIEVSRADAKLDDNEQASIKSALAKQFGLSKTEIDDLYAMAESELDGSICLYQFTQMVNENYRYDDKVALTAAMWKVAYADGELDKYEDYLIRKVTELIYVSHTDFIKQKLLVAKQLGLD